jgi:hypothetical protein
LGEKYRIQTTDFVIRFQPEERNYRAVLALDLFMAKSVTSTSLSYGTWNAFNID